MYPGMVEPTYTIALKVWWAMLWRVLPMAAVCIILSAIAIGIVLAIIGMMLGMEQEQVRSMGGTAGGIMGLFLGLGVNLWVIRRLMTKGFGRYRLAVLEK